LTLSSKERLAFISSNFQNDRFVKKYIGAKDFIDGNNRYCIWITEGIKDEAYLIPELVERFQKVKDFRLASKKAATRKKAATPYFFDERSGSGIAI
jgi:hypothetical protein